MRQSSFHIILLKSPITIFISLNYLRTHGEGEVSILKRAYPRTTLELGKIVKELKKEVICTTFYIQDNELKQI